MSYLQTVKSFFFIIIILVCSISCTKESMRSGEQLASVTVKLKSTTGNYSNVFIDIKDVQLKVNEDEAGENVWLSLNTINTGTYNLFDLSGDSGLLLVNNFELKPTYIYEIRLVLGENNFIDINNVLYHFDVTDLGHLKPSNLVELKLTSNYIYDFEIDIDIDESVSFNETQNTMILDPEIYTEIRKY